MAQTLKIASWNVNSIRARLPNVLDWLKQAAPDVALLQEIKVQDEQFPRLEIEDLGYNLALHGQKSYNGVAILSKYPLDIIAKGLPEFGDEQARYIEGFVCTKNAAVRVASVYVPNGFEAGSDKFAYKLGFLSALKSHMQHLLKKGEYLVIGGDYNIAPENPDVYDPISMEGAICFHMDERRMLRAILNSGYTDAYRAMHPNSHQFTWWDYRAGSFQHNKGMRIDHLLLSPTASDAVVKAEVDQEARAADKTSDHAPIWCELKVE